MFVEAVEGYEPQMWVVSDNDLAFAAGTSQWQSLVGPRATSTTNPAM